MKLAWDIFCTVIAMVVGAIFVVDWWNGDEVSLPMLWFAIYGLVGWRIMAARGSGDVK
jgi:hypothetical protein